MPWPPSPHKVANSAPGGAPFHRPRQSGGPPHAGRPDLVAVGEGRGDREPFHGSAAPADAPARLAQRRRRGGGQGGIERAARGTERVGRIHVMSGHSAISLASAGRSLCLRNDDGVLIRINLRTPTGGPSRRRRRVRTRHPGIRARSFRWRERSRRPGTPAPGRPAWRPARPRSAVHRSRSDSRSDRAARARAAACRARWCAAA